LSSPSDISVSATGASRLVDALEEFGVPVVFGLPGVHNLAVWKALAASEIRLVGVRHEQAAVYAADGYARATGKVGVALVTTGPGAANTLGATGEAMASRSPVLVIATDIPSTLRREGVYRGVLHETRDQAAMFAPVTKATRVVSDAAEIGDAIHVGALAARWRDSGPVYVQIPTDLLAAPVGVELRSATASTGQGAMADVDRAAELLMGAEHPFIWSGGGAVRSGAGELIAELATRLAAPVVTTYSGRGIVPPDHPCFVPGPVHAREVGMLWDDADVVLAIGSDLDGMMTQNWLMPRPPTLIAINVDEHDATKNYPADLTLVGDATALIERLLPLVTVRRAPHELSKRLKSIATTVRAAIEDDEPQAQAFLDIMERALPPETVVVADMCIPGYWLAGYRKVPAPRKLQYPMGWGTLGFGFPASLGAALADQGPVVCVCGDGGFLFACGELATVAQERIPVTIVLVDDGGYGMLRFDQARVGDAPFGVDLAGPDFVALARAFGIRATALDGFGADFEDALARSVAGDEPEMIVVHAALKPPPTTSPRWYRRPDVHD
jgi:thiamine pyrophosphate-dependent acetolactate synthase large subunit-like protein